MKDFGSLHSLSMLNYLWSEVGVWNQDAWILEIFKAHRYSDVQWLIIQLNSIDNHLLVVLDLPASSSDWIPRGKSTQYKFSLPHSDSSVLVIWDEFDSFKSFVNILQSEEREVVALLPLNIVFIHCKCTHLGSGWGAHDFEQAFLQTTLRLEKGDGTHMEERSMREEDKVDFVVLDRIFEHLQVLNWVGFIRTTVKKDC